MPLPVDGHAFSCRLPYLYMSIAILYLQIAMGNKSLQRIVVLSVASHIVLKAGNGQHSNIDCLFP